MRLLWPTLLLLCSPALAAPWTLTSETDPFTDEVIKTAVVWDTTQKAQVFLSCTGNRPIVMVSNTEFLKTEGSIPMLYRLDQQPALKLNLRPTPKGTAGTLSLLDVPLFIPAFKDAGTFLVRLSNYNQEQFTYTFKLEGTRKTLAQLPCFVDLLDTPSPPPPPPAYVPPKGSQYFELGYFITQTHLSPSYRVFLDDLGGGEYRLLYKGEPVNFTLGASYVVLKDRMVGLKSAPALVYGSVWLPLEVLSLLGCESYQLVDTGLQATCQGNTLSSIARAF